MKAFEKINLSDYMGRKDYLSQFNDIKSIFKELDYIDSRLNEKNDLLNRAVLELKQIDLKYRLFFFLEQKKYGNK